jgi:hypothetical protein
MIGVAGTIAPSINGCRSSMRSCPESLDARLLVRHAIRPNAAHVLRLSASTAKREWRTAKAWLVRELGAESRR